MDFGQNIFTFTVHCLQKNNKFYSPHNLATSASYALLFLQDIKSQSCAASIRKQSGHLLFRICTWNRTSSLLYQSVLLDQCVQFHICLEQSYSQVLDIIKNAAYIHATTSTIRDNSLQVCLNTYPFERYFFSHDESNLNHSVYVFRCLMKN